MKNGNKMMIMDWLSRWEDCDLEELRALIDEETHARERKREETRKNWIDKHYNQYQNSTARAVWVGETVVVAVKWMGHIKMATATPVNGDKCDTHTGIAVAYAKACGERIPDFV